MRFHWGRVGWKILACQTGLVQIRLGFVVVAKWGKENTNKIQYVLISSCHWHVRFSPVYVYVHVYVAAAAAAAAAIDKCKIKCAN